MSAAAAQLFIWIIILLPAVQSTHKISLVPFRFHAIFILSSNIYVSASKDLRFCR